MPVHHLFFAGVKQKLVYRKLSAMYGTVPFESCNRPSMSLWGALGYPCPAGGSLYIRAVAAGEETSGMVFYSPPTTVVKLPDKLRIFGEIMGTCGNEQTLSWDVNPGSRAVIHLTNLAACMHTTLPRNPADAVLNNFRGVATIASYSPAGAVIGNDHSSHPPSDDYGAAAPLGFIVTNSYDVYVPWNHPGNPEPGRNLQLAIYFFSAPFWR